MGGLIGILEDRAPAVARVQKHREAPRLLSYMFSMVCRAVSGSVANNTAKRGDGWERAEHGERIVSTAERREQDNRACIPVLFARTGVVRNCRREQYYTITCNYTKYGITPLLSSTVNRTKILKQVYGEGARIVNEIPQWFLFFSHPGRASWMPSRKNQLLG